MKIPPPVITVTLTGPAPRAPEWQPGQRLEGLVLPSDPAGGQTRVRIGDLQLSLRLPAALPEGSRLSLQVIQAGAQPVVRVLSQVPAQAAATTDRGSSPPTGAGTTAPRWLANLLPAQGSQAPLLATLAALDRNPSSMAALPAGVRDALSQLFLQLPTAARIRQPEGLREAVQRSGIFHEAALAMAATTPAGGIPPPADLKSALLSLAARLRSLGSPAASLAAGQSRETAPPRPGTPPTAQARMPAEPLTLGPQALLAGLRARTDQAVARLALHQWTAVEAADSGQLRWLLELPLRGDNGVDLVHLLTERERERPPPEEEPAWRAELALDLPELGPLRVRIAVTADQVRVHLWTELDDTLNLARKELPRLHQALQDHGLRVRDLGCNPGRPPETRAHAPMQPLLDDRA
ncbi:flagellar hook-length control protein FliK [Thioalkalivibrio sp.]|uniref:flagellar hook-length control protein FliK n=1 Tax=Thioalkalivibrio sp. TaxID=2093813 RepID=UPI003977167D